MHYFILWWNLIHLGYCSPVDDLLEAKCPITVVYYLGNTKISSQEFNLDVLNQLLTKWSDPSEIVLKLMQWLQCGKGVVLIKMCSHIIIFR